ncbi:hypothetical protein [Lysinibacillus pakistanensis]|uniref:hypothetical protein n=1 Tax=Lysinibacillus pakistanensis TaxID=759811 RepID=UPI003D27C90D
MKKLATFLVLTIVLLVGCTTQAPEKEKAAWEPFIGTYVGDHMKVSKIANTVFMHGDTVDHFDLRWEVLRVIYRNDNEALNSWFSSSTSKEKALVYNAMMGAILVPNAQGYGFEIDGELYEVPRDELITEMESLFPTLPHGNDFFEEEIVEEFLTKHEQTIQQYAVDPSYQSILMKKFLITKTS